MYYNESNSIKDIIINYPIIVISKLAEAKKFICRSRSSSSLLEISRNIVRFNEIHTHTGYFIVKKLV